MFCTQSIWKFHKKYMLYLLVFFFGVSTFHRDALAQHHVAWKLDI